MMANRINVGYNTIFKRSSCINSTSDALDAKRRFNNLNSQLSVMKEDGHISPSVLNSLRSFMEGICDINNANKYHRDSLYLIQEFNRLDNSNHTSDYILKEYTNRILPYVEDLTGLFETVDRFDLTNTQRKSILESANQYIIADRILSNHDRISKRFNILSEISKLKYRGLESVVETCCGMIDTYSISPYAKFNLCLEEMGYIFDKEGISVDKKDLVKYTTEYFLLRSPNISNKDLKGYRKVLNENCYIAEEDTEPVMYVINNVENERRGSFVSIAKEIQFFLISQEKSLQDLENLINTCMSSATWVDIKANLSKLVWLIWNVYRNNIIDVPEDTIPIWFDIIIRRLTDEDSVSKMDLQNIVININSLKNLIITTTQDDYEYTVAVCKFKGYIDEFVTKIESLSFVNYSESNLDAIKFVNMESSEPIPLNEFKIFKFHNLIRASMNLDKYLKYKEKNIYNNGKQKTRKVVKKIKDVLFPESTDIYSYIGEDAKADLCIGQYYYDEFALAEVHEYFDSVCKEFNNKLVCENMDSIRCYYIMNPSIVEVHLKESNSIDMTEDDWKLVHESYDNSLDIYINKLAESETCLEKLSEYSFEELNIQERLNKFFENSDINLEEFKLVLEALSFLNISKEEINVFSEQFTKYRYNMYVLESSITESEYQKETNVVKSLSEKWENENGVPLDIQIEAFQILDALLESDTKDNPNTKVDESRKNPFKGINLNSMRLYLEGLKGKLKDMSTKEKEISRNLDNNFRRFVKAMKDSLVSDRREAIIKGSVIPSFSRCIKICIGLAGLGLVTGNPVVPLLAAMGGFAVSKNLTQKERVLLLDEIETELDVVEKEISMAESKNQMKKYRALLKYKKDLQRQYQRIRYNIRIGKDILPNSATGVRGNNND